MVNVELGQMKFDHESLQALLMLIDRVTGKQYKDFELSVNQGQKYLKLRGRCRNCKRLVRSEQDFNQPGWAERIVDVFISEAETHTQKAHTSLLILPGRMSLAIRCDVCRLEAGTDATECLDEAGQSMWVCRKCSEAADRYATSKSVGYGS